jgi:hypothetical protein
MGLVNLLSESYKEFKELNNLCDDIFNYFVKINKDISKDFYKQYIKWKLENGNTDDKKSFPEFDLSKITTNVFFIRTATGENFDKKYPNIFPIISGVYNIPAQKHKEKDYKNLPEKTKKVYAHKDYHEYLSIFFSKIYNAGGVYFSKDRIALDFPNDEFKRSLTYNFKILSEEYKNKIPPKKRLDFALRSSLGATYRSILLHELQHAYDDYRSGGLYAKDKESKQLYNMRAKRDARYDKQSETEPSHVEWLLYYQVPHEYWARYNETLNYLLSSMHRPFQKVFDYFKMYMTGWKVIKPKNQKKIIRSLYKFWKEYNEEKNSKNKPD